jgi:predicted PurR-regulated permease PerM
MDRVEQMSDNSAGGGTPVAEAGNIGGTLQVLWRTPPTWVKPLLFWILLGVIGLRIGTWVFHGLSSLIGLLFMAWLFSIAIDPAVTALNKRGMRRGFATGLVMLTLFVLTALFLAVFGKLLVDQVVQLAKNLPAVTATVLDWFNRTFHASIDVTAITNSIDTSKVVEVATKFGGGLFGIVTSLVGLIFKGFTLLLFAFYMSAQQPQMQRRVASWLPESSQRIVLSVWDIARAKTGGYVFSRLILAILSATFTSAFLLVIGVDYWLPLGIWVGMVSQFIPTIGTYLGGALPVLIALGESPLKALLVLGFILLYQQIENYFFAPRVTSRTVDIHPAVAFGSVIAGGALFGAWGALVAIPIVAAIEAVMETYGRRYELIPELRHAGPDEEPVIAATAPAEE